MPRKRNGDAGEVEAMGGSGTANPVDPDRASELAEPP